MQDSVSKWKANGGENAQAVPSVRMYMLCTSCPALVALWCFGNVGRWVVCRLSSGAKTKGRRIGGQGAVAFGHETKNECRELAIKFFFKENAFHLEKQVMMDPVSV
jgi:hypothetical protein